MAYVNAPLASMVVVGVLVFGLVGYTYYANSSTNQRLSSLGEGVSSVSQQLSTIEITLPGYPTTTTVTVVEGNGTTIPSGSWLLKSVSLSVNSSKLAAVFSPSGVAPFGVKSVSLSGPTIAGTCTLTSRGLTLQPGRNSEGLVGNFSHCKSSGSPIVAAGYSYTYEIVLASPPVGTGQSFSGSVTAT